jgi:hypothetical protein
MPPMRTVPPILLALALALPACEDPATPAGSVKPACMGDAAAAECALGVEIGAAQPGPQGFTPLVDGDVLPVFDGTQGVVATWVSIRITNGQDLRPRLRIEVTDETSGEVLASSGALLTPFQDSGDGVYLRVEHMVPFEVICCAKDYDGLTVRFVATVTYDDGGTAKAELEAVLDLAPFPL